MALAGSEASPPSPSSPTEGGVRPKGPIAAGDRALGVRGDAQCLEVGPCVESNKHVRDHGRIPSVRSRKGHFVLTRRTFIKTGAAAVAGAMLPMANVQKALALAPAPLLTPFLDPLPIPPVKAPIAPGGTAYAMSVAAASHSYHTDLGATTVWGYDGIYPGPTFVATRGIATTVEVTNNITAGAHPFAAAFDSTIPGNVDDGRIAVHQHGGENAPASDGNPLSFFMPGESKTYEYGNSQKGAILWYHDHALGNTRLNVMAGLAGFYLLVDPDEEAIFTTPTVGLPALDYTVGLAIQDRDFYADGSVNYPTVPDPGSGHDHWVPEYFGDNACVNGKVTPFLAIEPRAYRFLVLNGAQARFFNLSLSDGRPFHVIGSDGGFLAAPTTQTSLMIAPGERYDVVIDFTGVAATTTINMTNDAVAPFPSGTLFMDPARTETSMNVMQFKVTVPLNVGIANKTLHTSVPTIQATEVPAGVRTRSLFLNEVATPLDVVTRVMLNNTGSMDTATEVPQVGQTEIWEIANTTADTHPIHLHLVQFRLLSRQKFDDVSYRALALSSGYYPPVARFLTGGVTMMGTTPRAQETAWKDTVLMHPGEVTRILVKFAPQEAEAVPGTIGFGFDPTDAPGYVWHCHILEHEENDMMRPLMLSATYAGRGTAISVHRSLSSVRLKHTVRIWGYMTPGELGDLVTIQVKRPGSKTWVTLTTVYNGTIGGARAGWTYTYKPSKLGTYYVRAKFAGTADRGKSTSPTVKFRVFV